MGLASLVDGAVVWAQFIQQIISVYRTAVREPLQWIAFQFWPASWPSIPPSAFDVLVIWSCLFLSLNLMLYRATGETLLSKAFAMVRNPKSFLIFLLVSTAMFVTAPFGALRMLLTPSEYRHNPYFPWRRDAVISLLYSLMFVVGAFVLMLFVNFQIGISKA